MRTKNTFNWSKLSAGDAAPAQPTHGATIDQYGYGSGGGPQNPNDAVPEWPRNIGNETLGWSADPRTKNLARQY